MRKGPTRLASHGSLTDARLSARETVILPTVSKENSSPRRWPGPVALVFTGLALCGLAVSAYRWFGDKGGTPADWLGALATLAAFLGAAWAVVYGRRAATHARETVEIERARDRAREEEQRRAQADKVAAWFRNDFVWRGPRVGVTWLPDGQAVQRQEPGVDVPESIRATVRNASDLPVEQFSFDWYVKPRGTDEWLYVGSHLQGQITPETTLDVETVHPGMAECFGEVLQPFSIDDPGATHVFLGWSLADLAGGMWRREPGGSRTEAVTDFAYRRVVTNWRDAPEWNEL